MLDKVYEGSDRIDLFTSVEGLRDNWVGVGIQPRIRRILASPPPVGHEQDLSRGMLSWDRSPVMYTFEDEPSTFLRGFEMVKDPKLGQEDLVKRHLEKKDIDGEPEVTVIKGKEHVDQDKDEMDTEEDEKK